jgi:acyl-CoA dehydrogenase
LLIAFDDRKNLPQFRFPAQLALVFTAQFCVNEPLPIPARYPHARKGAVKHGAPRTAVARYAPQEEPMPDILELSPKAADYKARLERFMDERIYPNERELFHMANTQPDQWEPLKLLQEIKEQAKVEGLWNLFLPDSELGAGLTNLEYAPLAEAMGRSHWGPEAFNCSAPDTGNMEVLVRYGTEAQKERWLKPLLAGEIRSGFAMTEPGAASSDATNISISIKKDGGDYVINGRKWWTSGAGDKRCKILILMGKTDPDNPDRHRQQSMILVPMDTPGVKKERMLPVFGYIDAPHGHGELSFTDVRVPQENVLLGEGRGFEIAQGRLGPGRIHHCMRTIGRAERALEKMCKRLQRRVAFGRPVADQSVWLERIAESRMMIDQARLLTLKAAHMMDAVGNKAARAEIAMIKVVAPNMACKVIDWAIQAHGGAGVCDDYGLAFDYAMIRTLRIADGPDEVHRNQIAKLELRKYRQEKG